MTPILIFGALVLLAVTVSGRDGNAASRLGQPGPPSRRRDASTAQAPSHPAEAEIRRSAPPEVAEATLAMLRGQRDPEQLRSAAEAARKAGLDATARVMDLTGAASEEVARIDAPATVKTTMARVTSGASASRAEMQLAAADAERAGMPATAALFRDYVEATASAEEGAEEEQARVREAVYALRDGRATVDQLVSAADAAARQGMTETARALTDAVPPPRPVLRSGDKGTDVRELQAALKIAGFDPGAVDGDFGAKTKAAVLAFQRAKGIATDGVAGPQTWGALELPRPAADAASRGALAGDEEDAAEGTVDGTAEGAPSRWRHFVRVLSVASPTYVGPRGHLGMFMYDPRRLETLGVMHNIRADESGKRTGEFTPPFSASRWLDPRVQGAVFQRDMARMRRIVTAAHDSEIGKVHAGRPATMSGLLAVAHAAGPAGLKSWLANDADKTRFRNTTAAYLRTTGIF